MPTTTGMKGGGYYDAHSSPQRAAFDVFLPWLEDALAEVPLPSDPGAPLALLDIGSSEGGNAIYAMNRLIQALRRVSDRPLWVFFDDLPTNDFNQLFANLYPDGAAALSGTDIFPGVLGGSAFGRLVPAQSLHVATTFNAIGFLEARPDAGLPHFILPMGPGPAAPRAGVSVTESERAPFRRQAARDLHRFYTARAEELVPGGKLLVQVYGRDETQSSSYGIYDVLSDAVLDQVEDGTLPREVYEALVFPMYFRTLEELVAPVETDERLAGAFRVEKAETREVAVPFNVMLEATGDVAAWARRYTAFLRAFTETILAPVLPRERPQADTLNRIYRQVERRLALHPERYELHYITIAALLTRV